MVAIDMYTLKTLHKIISVIPTNPTQQYQTKMYNFRQCFIHFGLMIVNNILQLPVHIVKICCDCYNSKIFYTQLEVLNGKIHMDVLINIGVKLHCIYCQCCLVHITL